MKLFFFQQQIYTTKPQDQNAFLKLKMNSAFCLKQANKRNFTDQNSYTMPVLFGGKTYFKRKMKLHPSLCQYATKQNSKVCCQLTSLFFFLCSNILAVFSLRSTWLAYSHRNLLSLSASLFGFKALFSSLLNLEVIQDGKDL